MTKDELLIHAYGSGLLMKWHWFRFHFEQHLRGRSHPFSESILRACLDCEPHIPGFAGGMINALGEISGKEKDLQHYEQLLQRLAELLVIRQVVTYPWQGQVRFRWEPTAADSKKNPELVVEGGEFPIGVEVKAPGLLEHREWRATNPTQLLSRVMSKEAIAELPDADKGITYPRDNPVKDFLISAEAKFAPFHRENPKFRGVLVIVWDDHINEPLTALIHPHSGLLTSKSFFKEPDGQPKKFPSMNAVILVRHLDQFMLAAGDEELVDDCRDALEYGRDGDFPPKMIIGNPFAERVPMEVVECFQAYTPSPEMGAEAIPGDLTWWMRV